MQSPVLSKTIDNFSLEVACMAPLSTIILFYSKKVHLIFIFLHLTVKLYGVFSSRISLYRFDEQSRVMVVIHVALEASGATLRDTLQRRIVGGT